MNTEIVHTAGIVQTGGITNCVPWYQPNIGYCYNGYWCWSCNRWHWTGHGCCCHCSTCCPCPPTTIIVQPAYDYEKEQLKVRVAELERKVNTLDQKSKLNKSKSHRW
jgi:hypothetical protein